MRKHDEVLRNPVPVPDPEEQSQGRTRETTGGGRWTSYRVVVQPRTTLVDGGTWCGSFRETHCVNGGGPVTGNETQEDRGGLPRHPL